MAADLTVLKRPHRKYTTALATGPVHVPRTFALEGAESGNVLMPSFFPVARMGAPLRAGTVGGTIHYNGANSFLRGGGAATGHVWNVYTFGGTTDGTYLADRGSLVTSATASTFDFVPGTAGTYSVELHLSGALEGSGTADPLGFGVRFLKVFAPGGADLEGIPELNGPNGTLDDGGVTLDLAYRAPDNLIGRQVVNHLMRVVVNHTLSYAAAGGVFEDYTWQPGYPEYDPEVLFSGLIRGSSIREDAKTHEIAYQLAGAQLPLTLCTVPLLHVSGVHDGEPYETNVPPAFYDEALWLLVRGVLDTTDPGWTHIITNLTASDPILHILQRHTNLLDFFDLALDQRDTDVIATTLASAGSVADWLRGMQGGRFGRLWTDRKSVIYCGPDDDLIPDAFKPASAIAIDGDLYQSIRVTHRPPDVGEIYVETADTLKADEAQWKVAPDDPIAGPIRQAVRAYTLNTTWTANSGAGSRKTYQAARYNDQAALDALAERLAARDNARFPAIECDFLLFPHLDLGQPVTIELDPHTEEAALEWNTGAAGEPLRVYVTGYTNTLDPSGKEPWKTTITFRESTNV